MVKRTKGYTDSTSIHSALAALTLGDPEKWTKWDKQSILETTYLLMFEDIGTIPGPGLYDVYHGSFGKIVRKLPSLAPPDLKRNKADIKVKNWLGRWRKKLIDAWDSLSKDRDFNEWARFQQEFFWLDHVRYHGHLFNEEYIGASLDLIDGCTESDLRKIHKLSAGEGNLKDWRRHPERDDSRIAKDAWLISALIRGKYHEFVAKESKVHLVSHPFKTRLWLDDHIQGPLEPVYDTEEKFVKIIIGSALAQGTAEARVGTWVENIVKTRQAIKCERLLLGNLHRPEDAERYAVIAAEIAEISSISAARVRGIGWLKDIVLQGISVLAWPVGLASTFLSKGTKQYTGKSLATHFYDFVNPTSKRFARLGRKIPGRIFRHIKWPSH